MSHLPGYLTGLVTSLCLAGVVAGRAPEVPEWLPAETRVVVGVRWKTLCETPLAKDHGTRWRELIGDLPGILKQLGIDPNQVDRLGIGLGESFPRGTVIWINGRFEPGRVEGRLNEWVRDKRFSARAVKDDPRSYFSIDLPVGSVPIPGWPTTLHIAVAGNDVIAATEPETLKLSLTKSAGPTKERFASVPTRWDRPVVAAIATPPALMTNGALLAGVPAIAADVTVTDALAVRIAFRPAEAGPFANRLGIGLDQARQLFGPLATQQGIEPRLIEAILESLKSAKIEAKDAEVVITTQLEGETLQRLLRK